MARKEAGYEFILRWDEVINARHLLSSASCQTSSGSTKECSPSWRAAHVNRETHTMPAWLFSELLYLQHINHHWIFASSSLQSTGSKTCRERWVEMVLKFIVCLSLQDYLILPLLCKSLQLEVQDYLALLAYLLRWRCSQSRGRVGSDVFQLWCLTVSGHKVSLGE